MEVSVVIPVRNGASTLPQQLDALARQAGAPPFEVVVVDNGSTDATAEVARAAADRLPGLRVVDGSSRIGINAARNQGIAAARGDLVLLCDADDVVADGWVAGMVSALADADLAGGAVDEVSLNGADALDWRPPVPSDRLPMALDFLPYAIGANLGMRRAVPDRLGGFDERYVRGGADVEFSWRAQLAGFRLVFAPDAVVAYRHRPDVRATMRQAYKYGLADVQLYANFRSEGLQRPPVGAGIQGWWALAVNLPYLAGPPARRGDWCRRAAHRAGRLRGSIRDRVLVL